MCVCVCVCESVCETFVRFIEKSKTDRDFSVSGKSCYIKWSCVYLYGRSRLISIISLSVTHVIRDIRHIPVELWESRWRERGERERGNNSIIIGFQGINYRGEEQHLHWSQP